MSKVSLTKCRYDQDNFDHDPLAQYVKVVGLKRRFRV